MRINTTFCHFEIKMDNILADKRQPQQIRGLVAPSTGYLGA